MSERSVRTILISLILHLILLLVLPGPYARKEPEQKEDTIELLLTMQSQQGKKGTPARSREKQPPEPSPPRPSPPKKPEDPPETEPPEKKPQKQPTEPAEQPTPEQTRPAVKEPPPEPEETETPRPPEPEKEPEKKPEPTPQETPAEDKQPTEEPSQEPTLLTRQGRFRSSASEPASSPSEAPENAAEQKTVLQDPFQRIRVSADLARELATPSSTSSDIDAPEPEQKSVVARVPVVHIGRTRKREPVNYSVKLPNQSRKSGSSSSKGRRALSQPLPSVPGWLEREGEEARVVVQYTLDGEGSVRSLRVIQSSGFPALDDEVIQKVQKWKFESGPDGEKRIVAFRFELSPSPET